VREAAGVSQESLALKAGVHRTYVSGIERGIRNPSLLSMYALADALGAEIGELFSAI